MSNATTVLAPFAFAGVVLQYPLSMDREQLAAQLDPILAEVKERSVVAEHFIDKDVYQISMATLWANIVLNPDDLGFTETDLEAVYERLGAEVCEVLGAGTDLKNCFAFLNSKPGELAMQKARINQTHKDMLLYFASMMLDPDGHRRWLDEIRDQTR